MSSLALSTPEDIFHLILNLVQREGYGCVFIEYMQSHGEEFSPGRALWLSKIAEGIFEVNLPDG